jgi:hypothetical protein
MGVGISCGWEQGKAFSVDRLLPVAAEDCDAVADLRRRLEDVRRIVAVGPAVLAGFGVASRTKTGQVTPPRSTMRH